MVLSIESLTIRAAGARDLDEIVAIDDDACSVFASIGLVFDFDRSHPFAVSEYARWAQSARDGDAYFACDSSGRAVGILVMGRVDGAPYLEQISVRASAMRQGVGKLLLAKAYAWAGANDLWLTTYGHVPWNRPYYERAGFTVVPSAQFLPGISAILDEQRRWLPAPEQRVAMVRSARRPVSSGR